MSCLRVIATGDKWIGYEAGSFSSAITQMMDSAREELAMTIYVISDVEILNAIDRALNRGVSTEIFIYENPEQNRSLFKKVVSLGTRYKHAGIHIIRDDVLHAKVLVCDAERVVLGSANPTFSGMVKNYELGLVVEDSKIAQQILTLLWRLNRK